MAPGPALCLLGAKEAEVGTAGTLPGVVREGGLGRERQGASPQAASGAWNPSRRGREVLRTPSHLWIRHLPALRACRQTCLSFPHAYLQASCLPFFPLPSSSPPPPPLLILRTHSHWVPGNGWCNFVTKCPESLCVWFTLLYPFVVSFTLGLVTEGLIKPGWLGTLQGSWSLRELFLPGA